MIQQEIHFVVSIVMTMFQGTKDNIINMTKTIHEYKDHIEILKEELDYAQRQNGDHPTKSFNLDGFKKCALEIQDDIYQAHQCLYLYIQQLQIYSIIFNKFMGEGQNMKNQIELVKKTIE